MLIFTNPGIIDPRSISTFGVNAKASTNPIGHFGTGLKYAIATILRNDGSITINDKGVYVSFTGSEALVRGFLAWAHETCGTNSQPRQGTAGNGHYWTTQIGGTVRVLRLLAALYDDAPTALTRKKALADLAVHGKPLQGAIF